MSAPDAAPAFLPCVHCEYDLRGLPIDGQCPECGELVAFARQKTTLHHADTRWLKRFTVALWLSAVSPLIVTAIEVLRITFQARIYAAWPRVTNVTLDAICFIALAAGPWLLTARPIPSPFDERPRRRLAARIVLLTLVGVKIVSNLWWLTQFQSDVITTMGRRPGIYEMMLIAAAINMLLTAVAVWMIGDHVRSLIRRAPRSSLDLIFAAGKWLVVVPLGLMPGLFLASVFRASFQQIIGPVLPITLGVSMVLGIIVLSASLVLAASRVRRIRRTIESAK